MRKALLILALLPCTSTLATERTILACQAADPTHPLLGKMDQAIVDWDIPSFEIRQASSMGTKDEHFIRYQADQYDFAHVVVRHLDAGGFSGAGFVSSETIAFEFYDGRLSVAMLAAYSPPFTMTYRCRE